MSAAAPWRRNLGEGVSLVGLTVLLLWLRRPDQFSHPYIWAEESWLLQRYAEWGVAGLAQPVNGIEIGVSKLIALLSFKISILQAPAIAVGLTAAFTCGVVLAIRFAPTDLRARYLCALLPLLIPTSPEALAVGLYAFWWAGLLIILALLWDSSRNHQGLRVAFILIGGISSPIIIPLSVLFSLRAWIERTRAEVLATGAAIAATAVQLAQWRTLPTNPPVDLSIIGKLPLALGKFVGWFASPSMASDRRAIFWGILVLAAIAATTFAARARLDRAFILLGLTFLAICAATLARIPVEAMHPYLSSARYFFYPYTLIGFALLWLAAELPGLMRALPVAILGLSLVLSLTSPWLVWHHDPLDFAAHLRACSRSDNYTLPVHTLGGRANRIEPDQFWSVTLRGSDCRKLIANSWIK